MGTLLHDVDRTQVLARVRDLTPNAEGRWGRLTAGGAVCHLSDQLRVAAGEVPVQRRDGLVGRTLGKWLLVGLPLRPPKGKVETAPEMLASVPGDWSEDLASLLELLETFPERAGRHAHPAFGPLTAAQWGALSFRHFDHHLRQFGV